MEATQTSGPAPAAIRFASLGVQELIPIARTGGAGFFVSLVVHTLLVATVIVLPLIAYDALPTAADRAARAFFAEPLELSPPPPPPAGARRVAPRGAPPPPLRARG